MNRNGTLERTEMTNGTEGGVLHLLRLTRTQCHAWVAFVALRGEDGTIDITAVPGADDESSEWTLDTLQGIVRQTLEDPLIGEGRAVIRVSEVFRRYWPGERQYTRMAVAPLNDVAEPGRPWGLLCALDPVDGQFSEAQLDVLGRLAVRFINHLRARRQFVSDAEASDALLSQALHEEPLASRPRSAIPAPGVSGPAVSEGEPLPDEGILRIERAATWLARQGEEEPAVEAWRGPLAEPSATEPEVTEPEAGEPAAAEPSAGAGLAAEPSEEVEVVFSDAFQVAPTAPAAPPVVMPPGVTPPAEPPAAAEPEVTEAMVTEPEVIEPEAAEAEPAEAPAPPAPEPAVRVQTTGWPRPGGVATSEAPAAAAPETSPEMTPETASAGVWTGPGAVPPGAAEPVPVRKVRLSELIDQLEATLSRLGRSKRNGALFLVELPPTLRAVAGDPVAAAAERLAEATRFNDQVLAVGSDMVAVVMELGPRPAHLEMIRERLLTASAGESEAMVTSELRASTVGLEPESGTSAEALVLNAVRQLGAR